MPELTTDILVIGAGPAGMMAAIAAARSGKRVAICDQMAQPGRKLLATGGGRCNLTNTLDNAQLMAAFGPEGFFMRQALAQMDGLGLRRFFSALGVPTHSPDGIHVFPVSESAQDVLDALTREMARLGVTLLSNTCVRSLRIDGRALRGVEIDGSRIDAPAVIIATGGKSYPESGSTGHGYVLAHAVGHSISPPVPALVPLITEETWPRDCAGVVLKDADVWVSMPQRGHRFRQAARGELLFTHRGVSGPAALDLSRHVSWLLVDHKTVPIRIDLTPDRDLQAWTSLIDEWQRVHGKKMVRTLLDAHLPGSLASVICTLAGIKPEAQPAEVTRPQRQALAQLITGLPLTITGTEGFGKAMVTRGGVYLKEVDPATLESRIVKGLFFAGEVLDLDGPCGGYNLTWAFASGWLAGKAAAGTEEEGHEVTKGTKDTKKRTY